MPRVGDPVVEDDAALVLGTHVVGAGLVRVLRASSPKTRWINMIHQAYGVIPLGWRDEGLRVNVGGHQRGAFVEQVALGFEEAFGKPAKTHTVSAFQVFHGRGVPVLHGCHRRGIIFVEFKRNRAT